MGIQSSQKQFKMKLALVLAVAAALATCSGAAGINSCNGCSILNAPTFNAKSTFNIRKEANVSGVQVTGVQGNNNAQVGSSGDFYCNGCSFPAAGGGGADGAMTVCNGCVIKNSAVEVSYSNIINVEVGDKVDLMEADLPSHGFALGSGDVPTYNVQQAYNYNAFNPKRRTEKKSTTANIYK